MDKTEAIPELIKTILNFILTSGVIKNPDF